MEMRFSGIDYRLLTEGREVLRGLKFFIDSENLKCYTHGIEEGKVYNVVKLVEPIGDYDIGVETENGLFYMCSDFFEKVNK